MRPFVSGHPHTAGVKNVWRKEYFDDVYAKTGHIRWVCETRCDFACHSHGRQMLKISALCSAAEITVLYVGHRFCVCLSLIIRCPLLKGIGNEFRRLVGKRGSLQ